MPVDVQVFLKKKWLINVTAQMYLIKNGFDQMYCFKWLHIRWKCYTAWMINRYKDAYGKLPE